MMVNSATTPENLVQQTSNPTTEAVADPYTGIVLPQTESKESADYTEQERSQYIKISSGERVDNFYARKDNIVSYKESAVISKEGEVMTFRIDYVPIVGVDTDTFEINTLWPSYARDKQFVYIAGHIIFGADPKTFVPVCGFSIGTNGSCGFSKDAIRVYWYDQVVKNADPKTFVFVYGGKDYPSFALDASTVYRGNGYAGGFGSTTVESIKILTDGQAIHFVDTSKIKVDPLAPSWADFHDGLTVGDNIYTEWVSVTDATTSYSIYSKLLKGSDRDSLLVSKVAHAGDQPSGL